MEFSVLTNVACRSTFLSLIRTLADLTYRSVVPSEKPTAYGAQPEVDAVIPDVQYRDSAIAARPIDMHS